MTDVLASDEWNRTVPRNLTYEDLERGEEGDEALVRIPAVEVALGRAPAVRQNRRQLKRDRPQQHPKQYVAGGDPRHDVEREHRIGRLNLLSVQAQLGGREDDVGEVHRAQDRVADPGVVEHVRERHEEGGDDVVRCRRPDRRAGVWG